MKNAGVKALTVTVAEEALQRGFPFYSVQGRNGLIKN
jgi:hypothetical protein